MSEENGVLKLLRGVIVDVFGLGFGIFLAVFLLLVVPAFTLAYWPFYSFPQQSLFVNAIHEAYSAESVGAKPEDDIDSFYLIAGKVYCGTKFFGFGSAALNALKSLNIEGAEDNPFSKEDYTNFLDTVAKDASTYLCPSSIPIKPNS